MVKYNGMKVGDLITTYNKGFSILERIEERFVTQEEIDRYGYNMKVGESHKPLFHHVIKFDDNGLPKKSNKIKMCDASYCSPASEYIDSEIKKMNERIDRLFRISGFTS